MGNSLSKKNGGTTVLQGTEGPTINFTNEPSKVVSFQTIPTSTPTVVTPTVGGRRRKKSNKNRKNKNRTRRKR